MPLVKEYLLEAVTQTETVWLNEKKFISSCAESAHGASLLIAAYILCHWSFRKGLLYLMAMPLIKELNCIIILAVLLIKVGCSQQAYFPT